jgi:hypothetical protein
MEEIKGGWRKLHKGKLQICNLKVIYPVVFRSVNVSEGVPLCTAQISTKATIEKYWK